MRSVCDRQNKASRSLAKSFVIKVVGTRGRAIQNDLYRFVESLVGISPGPSRFASTHVAECLESIVSWTRWQCFVLERFLEPAKDGLVVTVHVLPYGDDWYPAVCNAKVLQYRTRHDERLVTLFVWYASRMHIVACLLSIWSELWLRSDYQRRDFATPATHGSPTLSQSESLLRSNVTIAGLSFNSADNLEQRVQSVQEHSDWLEVTSIDVTTWGQNAGRSWRAWLLIHLPTAVPRSTRTCNALFLQLWSPRKTFVSCMTRRGRRETLAPYHFARVGGNRA